MSDKTRWAKKPIKGDEADQKKTQSHMRIGFNLRIRSYFLKRPNSHQKLGMVIINTLTEQVNKIHQIHKGEHNERKIWNQH
ncbi:hypothetical protein BKH46_07420 [Helicobacter sp. 12S02634-8]|nr:hypothetical protein BKH46_07420 [Helicobacter sp. 12S02634-8]